MGKTQRFVCAVAACTALLALATPKASAAEFRLDFGANANATAQDVGLPFYPGSRLYKDSKDEESAAKVWGALGAFGMKIVAVKLESADAPAKIAPFYVGALGKYGRVLNCSAGVPKPPKADKNSRNLDCSDDDPKPGEMLFKSGVKTDFHVVGIEPHGRGSVIALVYIQLHGTD